MTSAPAQRPIDATLSVTKAARLLGVHPNTVRAWSDQGRLRYYRINPRGDRRYRLGDLQRFLAAAEIDALRHDGVPVDVARDAAARNVDVDFGQPAGPGQGPSGAPVTPNARAAVGRVPPRQRARDLGRPLLRESIIAPLDRERHRLDLRVLVELAALSSQGRNVDQVLAGASRLLREAYGLYLVGIWQLEGGTLVHRSLDGRGGRRLGDFPATFGSLGRALAEGRSVLATPAQPDWAAVAPESVAEAAFVIPGGEKAWGVLLAAAEQPGSLGEGDLEVFETAAGQLASAIAGARRVDAVAHQLHRAEALQRVAADIGHRLDLDQVSAGIVDHARVLFGADRVALFLRSPDGKFVAEASRGLSPSFLLAVRDFPAPSLPSEAVLARRPLAATNYRDDPLSRSARAAVVQEGFDTLCSAPLFDEESLLGLLNIYHDRPHVWSEDELETIAAFAVQASVAIKTAQDYAQMATWAAQLQSIQQLGARLNRLTSVREIGTAIATELRQLIDFHNVRVYRLVGTEDLIPVAMQGQVGEYIDETVEQLRTKVGQGITGWVAAHGIAQNLPDADDDPRCATIPGTDEDLDESMLLAPMVFEDQVLGVLVLSKLGLHQFTDDDLRLLVIYASFAAQAMANADATERLQAQSMALERQVRSQRELLKITESILSTLDSRRVLDLIADRLGALVQYDTISIEVLEPTGGLRPLTARGVHAERYLRSREPQEHALATWVIEHNEAQLVQDEENDRRVQRLAEGGFVGSTIVVPLRGREGATGVLTLERLGREDSFSVEEFELVKLFAAQVSIAIQNAETFSAVEIRARSDDLTRLLNHGTFQQWLARSVVEGEPFSLIMLDLDEFKAVNDTLGHQAGSRLLAEIADAIVAAGRDTDHTFRYGGDEFALILPGTDSAGGRQVAERVRQAVKDVGRPGTRWQEGGVRVSSSIGVAAYPTDGTKADLILLAADRACAKAKRSGGDRIATAEEGLAIAAEFSLQEPTPVDPPSLTIH